MGVVFASASELGRGIGAGEMSAVEVLEEHLARLGRHSSDVNAVVTVDEESARRRAQEADDAVAAGEWWGPLHGVPITIKDAFETAGLRTTAGFPPLADHVPERDATAVARLRAAGAVIVGKTNLPTMAIGYNCENPVFGRTNNPWDRSRTPGGSSGGAAAAVAGGLSPLDVGSDFAGSVRLPAHYCGVYGLKPTEHRIPKSGHIPPPPGAPEGVRHMAVPGPIARSVEDLRIALQLMAGPDGREWEVPPVPVEEVAPPRLEGLRVAWTHDFAGTPVTSDTRRALVTLAQGLEAEGCRVEETQPPGFGFPEVWETWGELSMAEIGSVMPQEQKEALAAEPKDPLESGQASMVEATMADFALTMRKRDEFIAALEEFFGGFDIWICPVSVGPAVPHQKPGTEVEVDGTTVPHLLGGLAHCAPISLTGHPAVTMPITGSTDQLPIGCQVIARRWADMELLAVAEQLAELSGGFAPPPGFSGK